MAVAANDGHSWMGISQFRSDDMHNPVVRMVQSEIFDAKFLAVLSKFIDLVA